MTVIDISSTIDGLHWKLNLHCSQNGDRNFDASRNILVVK